MNAKQCLNPNASAQVAAAPFAARPLRGLAFRCATRGPERCRVRPSWLRRSFSSRQQRSRVLADPKTHHTLRHMWQPNTAAHMPHGARLFHIAPAFHERRHHSCRAAHQYGRAVSVRH